MAVLETQAAGVPRRQGKVRDLYDLGERMVMVATDRISAFDWILPTPIPDKGQILTGISLFWFAHLGETEQIISTDLADMGPAFAAQPEVFAGRSLLVRRYPVVPIECVVRGYLAGSGWAEYQQTQTVGGHRLGPGLQESDRLAEPIFTPATKAASGHDENITIAQMADHIGTAATKMLEERSLSLYSRAAAHAAGRGIILADTKFEFGQRADGGFVLIDEALTPDSSRFWPADQYQPGSSPPSYDKQFIRNWLLSIGFDRNSPPPPIPEPIVMQTRQKYIQAYEAITGQRFE